MSDSGYEILKNDLKVLRKKYMDKVNKIEAKKYVSVKGEKVSSPDELRDMYEADMITLNQMEKYEDKLKNGAGEKTAPYKTAIARIDVYLDDLDDELSKGE